MELNSFKLVYPTPFPSFISLATRAGSPQQREPITVGPYYLSHPVNFPCEKKPEYSKKTHDFRQSVTIPVGGKFEAKQAKHRQATPKKHARPSKECIQKPADNCQKWAETLLKF